MLDQEIQFFERNRDAWLKTHWGKFVLVKGDRLLGVFDTADQAVAQGARLVGLEPFLVREVQEKEEEIFIPALEFGLIHANPPPSK